MFVKICGITNEDDALLAVFGEQYVDLHGNAHRVSLLAARLDDAISELDRQLEPGDVLVERIQRGRDLPLPAVFEVVR